MTVVYDLLGFQSRDHGERGIARYVLNLALALDRGSPELVTDHLVHPDLPFGAGAEPLIATGRLTRVDRTAAAFRPSDGGVFVATSPFEEFRRPSQLVIPAFARGPRWRTMAILYDLIPAIFPDDYLSDPSDRRLYQARVDALGHVDHLLAISEATADDAVDLLGLDRSRVTVIGAGADDRFVPPPEGAAACATSLAEEGAVPGIGPSYVLFPTGIDPRKNTERTIEAWGLLPPEVRANRQLVVTCHLTGDDHRRLSAVARRAGLTVAKPGAGGGAHRGDENGEVLLTGFVSDPLLLRLYQGAHLVLFPSLYEGFGLPALEAMRCGAPVICSDTSSLREVQPDPAARFDPSAASSIAAAVERVLGDDELRARLREQTQPHFTWDHAAELTAEAIGRLDADRRRSGPGPARPRLALFTPLPPQQSGIATYAARLLDELRHRCDVTAFVDVDPASVSAPDGVAIESIDRFNAITDGGGAFDHVLYFLGNSHYHLGMFEALREHRGAVLLHDVRLSGLYQSLAEHRPDLLVDGSVGRTLATQYPGRYRPALEELDVIPPDIAERFGILLSREVVGRADQVFVHSRYAADLLQLDGDADPTVLFPLPCPTPSSPGEPAVESVGASAVEAPIVSSFGIVSTVKRPATLIEALPLIHERVPGTRLRFVGPSEEGDRSELAALAERLGVGAEVEFVGYLDDDGFAAAQADTTVAVQLRATSNGESSAAVTELLARGVPTVVSAIGTMTELPPGAVATVAVSEGAEGLATVIAGLLEDRSAREVMAAAARCYATENSFARAADLLLAALTHSPA